MGNHEMIHYDQTIPNPIQSHGKIVVLKVVLEIV